MVPPITFYTDDILRGIIEAVARVSRTQMHLVSRSFSRAWLTCSIPWTIDLDNVSPRVVMQHRMRFRHVVATSDLACSNLLMLIQLGAPIKTVDLTPIYPVHPPIVQILDPALLRPLRSLTHLTALCWHDGIRSLTTLTSLRLAYVGDCGMDGHPMTQYLLASSLKQFHGTDMKMHSSEWLTRLTSLEVLTMEDVQFPLQMYTSANYLRTGRIWPDDWHQMTLLQDLKITFWEDDVNARQGGFDLQHPSGLSCLTQLTSLTLNEAAVRHTPCFTIAHFFNFTALPNLKKGV